MQTALEEGISILISAGICNLQIVYVFWCGCDILVSETKLGERPQTRPATEKHRHGSGNYRFRACDFFLDISDLSQYNLIRILDCHRVVSESACLHIVRS